MRGMLGIVGVLMALAVVGLAAKQMVTRPVAREPSSAPVGTPAQAPRQATDRVKAELDEAARRSADRASEAGI